VQATIVAITQLGAISIRLVAGWMRRVYETAALGVKNLECPRLFLSFANGNGDRQLLSILKEAALESFRAHSID
jgi:hypothetical protein